MITAYLYFNRGALSHRDKYDDSLPNANQDPHTLPFAHRHTAAHADPNADAYSAAGNHAAAARCQRGRPACSDCPGAAFYGRLGTI